MKTAIIGFKELRENSEKYINAVDSGHSFIVVRRSKPVFKITPVDDWGDDGIWESAVDFRKLGLNSLSAKNLLSRLLKIGNKKD
jgi:prevent-host-death family protein